MGTYISEKFTRFPGVAAFIKIDTSQFTKRLRNNVIKQLRTGVYARSETGTLAVRIFEACCPREDWPVYRWWSGIVIYNKYIDTAEMRDLLDAIVTAATLTQNRKYSVSGAPHTVNHDETNKTQLYGCLDQSRMINMSLSKKWKGLVDPIIARIEADETFIYNCNSN